MFPLSKYPVKEHGSSEKNSNFTATSINHPYTKQYANIQNKTDQITRQEVNDKLTTATIPRLTNTLIFLKFASR